VPSREAAKATSSNASEQLFEARCERASTWLSWSSALRRAPRRCAFQTVQQVRSSETCAGAGHRHRRQRAPQLRPIQGLQGQDGRKVLAAAPRQAPKADGEQNEKPQCQPPKPDLFLFQVAGLRLMPGRLVFVWHKFRPVRCGREEQWISPVFSNRSHMGGPYNATRVSKLVRWPS